MSPQITDADVSKTAAEARQEILARVTSLQHDAAAKSAAACKQNAIQED